MKNHLGWGCPHVYCSWVGDSIPQGWHAAGGVAQVRPSWSCGLWVRDGVRSATQDLSSYEPPGECPGSQEAGEPPGVSLRPGHYVICLHFIVRPRHPAEKY